MPNKKNIKYYGILLILILAVASCGTNKSVVQNPATDQDDWPAFRLSGGSSGMEQIDDHTYVVVYDLKGFQDGFRMGLIKVSNESLSVSPIEVNFWGEGGISSDLESICRIPGKQLEFLMAESGNWQGKLGRIFHVKVDTANLKASVLGSVIIPMLYQNDFSITGDQYEAIICLPYDENKRIVVLGERGGSRNNPHGIVRWGTFDLNDHSFTMSDAGIKGLEVDVPGNWIDASTKRDITDFHIDLDQNIWAVASEDQGDAGPFYSAIYKLGHINQLNKDKPFIVFDTIEIAKDVNGFKIESLSGACRGINASHSFGSEDEIYGGVWRPINIE